MTPIWLTELLIQTTIIPQHLYIVDNLHILDLCWSFFQKIALPKCVLQLLLPNTILQLKNEITMEINLITRAPLKLLIKIVLQYSLIFITTWKLHGISHEKSRMLSDLTRERLLLVIGYCTWVKYYWNIWYFIFILIR